MAPLGKNSMVPHMVDFMVANSIVCFLALAVVGLRVYCRVTTEAGLGYDDAFILVSMVIGITLLSIYGLLCTSGVGHTVEEVGENNLTVVSLISASNALYIGTTITYKLSVLFFYLRIFAKNTKTRIATYISIAFFVAWGIGCFVQLFAMCQPDPNDLARPTCDRNAVMLDASALCIFGDLVVLILPLPAIWNLHMDLRNKVKLTFLFLLGSVVTIIAVLRCVSIIRQDFDNPEYTLIFQDPLGYAVLEPNMGVLCASLPMVHNQLSAWKTKLLDIIKSPTEPQSQSSQLVSERTDWNHHNTSMLSRDTRYGYTVSITAGK